MAWHKVWTDITSSRKCSTKWVEYAYEQTCEGSPLRNLAVDQLMYSTPEYLLESRPKELPHALLHDMVVAYSRAVQPREPKVYGVRKVIEIEDSSAVDLDDLASNDSSSDTSVSDTSVEYWKAVDHAARASKRPEKRLLMVRERHRYRCSRAWRGYLVPEDIEE